MKLCTAIFAIIILLLGITFAGLNAEHVHLNYYFGSRQLPLSLLLALTLLCGAIIGMLGGLVVYVKQKRAVFRLRHRIKTIEKELSNLRTIPIKDNH